MSRNLWTAQQYWLLKSEPDEYSWSQLQASGKGTWDGVRNYQACNNLQKMLIGDLAFFYHTGTERSIVGIVTISKAAFSDPTDPNGRFVAVEVEPVLTVTKPVTLEQIKKEQELERLKLVKQPRLSVVPIGKVEWGKLLGMMGVIAPS